jgi:hypothetical protein
MVDGYARNGKMMHASRGDGGTWSSKFGDYIRAIHPRDRLSPNGEYGSVVVSFKRRAAMSESSAGSQSVLVSAPAPATHPRELPTMELDTVSASKAANLVERMAQAFPILTDEFDTKWNAWQQSWSKGPTLLSSSTAFAQGPEWDALVKLGPRILPQVVKKLTSDANIFGCDLCESRFLSSCYRH